MEIKQRGREADHSPPSRAEVKECVELYLHSPYVFMARCLVKHGNNFTLPPMIFIRLQLRCSYSHVGVGDGMKCDTTKVGEEVASRGMMCVPNFIKNRRLVKN
jgi:hypothetical protein